MGMKLWVIGVTLVLTESLLSDIPAVNVVGMVIMIIGAVLVALDK